MPLGGSSPTRGTRARPVASRLRRSTRLLRHRRVHVRIVLDPGFGTQGQGETQIICTANASKIAFRRLIDIVGVHISSTTVSAQLRTAENSAVGIRARSIGLASRGS